MGNIIHDSGKSVIKIDPATGDELETYQTIKAAHLAVTGKIQQGRSQISRVCKGKQTTAYDYGWKYSGRRPGAKLLTTQIPEEDEFTKWAERRYNKKSVKTIGFRGRSWR